MESFVVWIEGVDFAETLLDTQKLSVIRGASRALEAMPAATKEIRTLDPKFRRIAAGASQAGFIVTAGETDVEDWLKNFRERLRTQGNEPTEVEPVTREANRDLEEHAPFAHLRFHMSKQKINGDSALAIARARADIRRAQLAEPGVRLAPAPKPSVAGPCEFDRTRAAELLIDGPPRNAEDEAKGYSTIPMSRATAARWYFGRALRQRLYDELREVDFTPLKFVDDFQEMIAAPRPQLPARRGASQLRNLPAALEGKIAVFAADGDKFGALRADLTDALGPETGAGLVCMTNVLEEKMTELLHGLVRELDGISHSDDPHARAAAALVLTDENVWRRHRLGRSREDRLLRFETLLFGGDDVTFVVPG